MRLGMECTRAFAQEEEMPMPSSTSLHGWCLGRARARGQDSKCGSGSAAALSSSREIARRCFGLVVACLQHEDVDSTSNVLSTATTGMGDVVTPGDACETRHS